MAYKNTIAITGFGMVSALGRSSSSVARRLLSGSSGVKKNAFTLNGPLYTAARVSSPLKPLLNRWSVGRATAMALAATGKVVRINGDAPAPCDRRLGLIHVSTYGNLRSMLEYRADLNRFGLNRASPMQFPNTILHATASFLALATGAAAFNITLSGECVSGLEVLETARQFLEAGSADRVLCVASEELCPELISLIGSKEELEGQFPDPFGQKRSGYVPGEGAAAVMLELADSARSNRPVYCTLRGHSYSRRSGPDPASCEQAMRAAMDEADARFEDLGCIVANGNGGLNDSEEAEAISRVAHTNVPVTSMKSALGECGAAGSLLSIVAFLFCSLYKTLPPTAGRSKYDPKLPPIALLRRKQELKKPLFLVNSISSGTSVCQVLELTAQAQA
jgi:3-oxoacyl-[acyl-carrier-protein] synthase II